MRYSLLVLMLILPILSLSAENVPEGAEGFSGMIQCTVLKKKESKMLVKVEKIHKLWKGNHAKNPEVLVGRKIVVEEGWHKNHESGKFQPNEVHVNFIKKIKEGTSISLEIKTGDGDRFHILELNKEQRALGGHHGDGEKEHKEGGDNQAKSNLPAGARGFSGMVKAKVLAGNENGLAIKVEKTLKVWPNNKAENTNAFDGKVIVVKPGWFKNKNTGKWQQNEWHQHYVKKVKPGSVIEIEIGNHEGDQLHILELNKEQRTLVGHPHVDGEGHD